MYAIETKNLHKTYDDQPVLRGLNLRVVEGEAYGLLGPNGAGKSTLIHLLMGFLKPSNGRVRVLGTSHLYKVRGRMGYLPERAYYHMRYSAREYLLFLGYLSDMGGNRLRRRVDEELERFGLTDVASRPVLTFSKGMLQRLGLAQALLNNPDLLLLDEPTSGLDPAEQRELIDLLNEIRAQGHTILLCSHYLEQVEQVCDRIGVLAKGRLADEIAVQELHALPGNLKIRVDHLPPELCAQLLAFSPAVQCFTGEHERGLPPSRTMPTITLRPNEPRLQHTVVQTLLDANVTILTLEPLEHPLEQFYRQALSDIQDTDTGRHDGGSVSGVHSPATMWDRSQHTAQTQSQDSAPESVFDLPDIEPEVLATMLASAADARSHINENDPLLDELLFGQSEIPDESLADERPQRSSEKRRNTDDD